MWVVAVVPLHSPVQGRGRKVIPVRDWLIDERGPGQLISLCSFSSDSHSPPLPISTIVALVPIFISQGSTGWSSLPLLLLLNPSFTVLPG